MTNFNDMSGCAQHAFLKSIGYDKIRQLTDSDDMLAQYDENTLIDFIVNNDELDVKRIVLALTKSLCEDFDRGDMVTMKVITMLIEQL
jgi:hypothetical protein